MQTVALDALLDVAATGGLGAIAWDENLCLIAANDRSGVLLGFDGMAEGQHMDAVFGPANGGVVRTCLDDAMRAMPLELDGPLGPMTVKARRTGDVLITTLRPGRMPTAHRDLDIILEHLRDGVMVLDADARIVALNAQFRDVFGVSAQDCHDDMSAREFARLHADLGDLPPDELEQAAIARAAYAEGRLDQPEGVPVRRFLRNGRIVDVFRMVLHDGGAVLTARDMTEDALLSRERAYLETMLENMSDGVMMMDADHRAIAFNRRILELYRIDPQAVWVGIPVRDFIARHGDIVDLPQADRDDVIDHRLAATVEESVGTHRFERRLTSGRVLEVTRTLLDKGGFVLTVRDVTANVELAEQKTNLEVTLNSLTDAVLMTDRDGTITNLNRRVYDMFKVDPAIELRGMNLVDSIALHGDIHDLEPSVRAKVQEERRQVASGAFHPTGNFRLRVRLPGGIFADVVRTSLAEGGAVFSVRDVTESAELARKKQSLESMVEYLTEAVMMLDSRNRIVAINRAMLNLFQVARADMPVGAPVETLISPQRTATLGEEAASLLRQRYRSVLGNQTSGSFVNTRRMPTGEIVETTRTALPSGGALLTVRDKTDEVALSHERNLMRKLVDHVGEGILLFDQEGVCTLANICFLDMYEVSGDLTGQTILEIEERYGELLAGPATDGPKSTEERVLDILSKPARTVRPAQDGRMIEITRAPLKDGGSFIVHRDISAETECLRLQDQARHAARNVRETNSNFIARVTHELRTPMQGVLGMAALLQQTELLDNQRNCLDILTRSGRHMLDLIDGLMTISTLETGDLVLETRNIDLVRVVTHCAEMLRPRAMEKGLDLQVQLDVEDGSIALADEVRLTQIVTNMLANAVKYTQTGTVTVQLQTDRMGDQLVAGIAVVDTGPGIPDDKLQAIFEKFYQMREHGQADGVGLGLAIAKSLTELMEGRLSVESEVGVGTTFTLTLTLDLEPPAELAQPA